MFVTVSPNIVEAEWRRNKKNKKKKKKKKKKSEEKNLGRNYKTSRPTDGMPNHATLLLFQSTIVILVSLLKVIC